MAEHTEIIVEITKLGGKMDAFHQRLDKHEENTVTRLDRHDEIIHGNGQPGLKAEIQGLVTKQRILWGALMMIVSSAVAAFLGFK